MSLAPKALQEFLEDFRAADPELRFELLIEQADRFHEVPPQVATRPFPESNKVPACESDAFVWAVPESDSLRLYFAVENPQGISAKALATILSETLSGAAVERIAAIDPNLVYEIFGRTISMGKGQGLMSMVNAVKALAMQAAKSQPN